MDRGEHLHLGIAGDGGGLADGRVAGRERALGLLLGEAGVVNEEVRPAGGLDRCRRGAGVAGDRDRPPGAALPHHLLRRDRPGGALDRLTSLQSGERRPFGDAEGLCGLEVESAGPLVLDQRVAAGTDAVGDLEGADLGVLELHHVAGLEFDQVETEADPPDQLAERLEQVLEAARAVDRERRLAVGEVVRFQHPRQAEEVIGVEVGQVDLIDLDQPQRLLKLALGPLAAIEHQPFAAPRDEQAGGRAPRRGHGAARAEEGHREVHRPSLEVCARERPTD